MAGIKLKYVHEYRDRLGTLRRYFRRGAQPQVTLPGLPGSEEFMEAYGKALAGQPVNREIGSSKTVPGTIAAAVAAYFNSAQFLTLAPSTQTTYRNILNRFRDRNGSKSLANLERRHIENMLAEMVKTPMAANNLLRMIRMLMQFAQSIGMVRADPTAGVKGLKTRSQGFYSWSEDDIDAFKAKHPLGTKARLALALLLCTAQRRGDVVLMGPQHIKSGVLRITQSKTGETVAIPVHAELAEAIAAAPSGHLTFLATKYGENYTANGFGNLFRDWCNEAGLKKCSSHGLRKAASRRLAEAGCTPHEIQAFTGHTTLKEVTRYTRAADKERLAKTAMEKVTRTPTG